MLRSEIALTRLNNHHLDGSRFTAPEQIVQWMGGMQAQDYDQAKWAIGSRLPGSVIEDVEIATVEKSIVRTWLFRGTLHFVHASDVHWMLQLVAPSLIQRLKTRHKELKLKESQFDTFYTILTDNLKRGKELSRTELTEIFKGSGIDAKGPRLYHILLKAGLEQVICCGAKKDTFRLLGKAKTKMSRDDSLREISKRYFASHGPATADDLSTWAGITLTDARKGIEAAGPALKNFKFEDKTYWHTAKKNNPAARVSECILLAGFDEYYLGYKDKNIVADSKHTQQIVQKNGIFNPVILLNGHVHGTWKRTFRKEKVIIELFPFNKVNKSQKELILAAADQFGAFVGRDVQAKI